VPRDECPVDELVQRCVHAIDDELMGLGKVQQEAQSPIMPWEARGRRATPAPHKMGRGKLAERHRAVSEALFPETEAVGKAHETAAQTRSLGPDAPQHALGRRLRSKLA